MRIRPVGRADVAGADSRSPFTARASGGGVEDADDSANPGIGSRPPIISRAKSGRPPDTSHVVPPNRPRRFQVDPEKLGPSAPPRPYWSSASQRANRSVSRIASTVPETLCLTTRRPGSNPVAHPTSTAQSPAAATRTRFRRRRPPFDPPYHPPARAALAAERSAATMVWPRPTPVLRRTGCTQDQARSRPALRPGERTTTRP